MILLKRNDLLQWIFIVPLGTLCLQQGLENSASATLKSSQNNRSSENMRRGNNANAVL